MGTGFFPGVKSGRGSKLTLHPLLVPWSRKSRAIPLLPLWAVRPVQSLSACTVELYLYSPMYPTACTGPKCLYSRLYLYSPMGRTACTEPQCLYRVSVPVQYSYTSTLPIGPTAFTEPQYLYRTSVPVQYSYTSNPPVGRTACIEPQCL